MFKILKTVCQLARGCEGVAAVVSGRQLLAINTKLRNEPNTLEAERKRGNLLSQFPLKSKIARKIAPLYFDTLEQRRLAVRRW